MRIRLFPRKRTRPRATCKLLAEQFQDSLSEVGDLIDRQQWQAARGELERLDRRYPGRRAVLAAMVEVYYQLGDRQAHQTACERLLPLTPDAPDLWLMLAGCYQESRRLDQAVGTFREYLRRWPDDVHASEVRKTVARLEGNLAGHRRHSGNNGSRKSLFGLDPRRRMPMLAAR